MNMVEAIDYGTLYSEPEMKTSLRLLVQHQNAPITHMERVFAEHLLYFVEKLDEFKADLESKFDDNVMLLNAKILEYDEKIKALEAKKTRKR